LTAERTRQALAHKKAHRKIYGPTPLGFTATAEGALEADAEELEVVSYIRELRASGLSYRAIAERLTAEGVPTKRGGAWYASTVSYILKNGLYEGVA
jgi:site-specific DNA recombinase